MERGWVMQGLLPWNRDCGKATGAAPAVQAMWVSRRVFKGYRGAAERSSNVGVPAFPEGYRGGARRSSKVGVPAFASVPLRPVSPSNLEALGRQVG